jgi:hypothetical protein
MLDRLDGLAFPMQFRGMPLRVAIEGDELSITADREGRSRPIEVGVGDETHELCPGDRCTFALRRETGVAH